MFKSNLKSFFSFTKREYNGLLVFGLLVLLVQFSPAVYSFFETEEKTDFSKFKKEIEGFEASAKSEHAYKYYSRPREETKTLAASYFNFDPNIIDQAGWRKLGLSDKQAHVITNYLSKGGRFYKPEDLKKIYSIRVEDYDRLAPYIKINNPKSAYKKDNKPFIFEKKEKSIVELNSADSVQLESLPGIGAGFASRIIKYRNRLGGFHSKEQLKEVYGLDSARYNELQHRVTVNSEAITTINVNTATSDELKKHPYLTYKQINAILQYQKQHGLYKSIEDLKKIIIINEITLTKIAPYLTF